MPRTALQCTGSWRSFRKRVLWGWGEPSGERRGLCSRLKCNVRKATRAQKAGYVNTEQLVGLWVHFRMTNMEMSSTVSVPFFVLCAFKAPGDWAVVPCIQDKEMLVGSVGDSAVLPPPTLDTCTLKPPFKCRILRSAWPCCTLVPQLPR